MRLAVPRSTPPDETRVAVTPDAIGMLTGLGVEVQVERDAGAAARYLDADYEQAGATVVAPAEAFDAADVVACVTAPTPEQLGQIPTGAIVVGLLRPVHDAATAQRLAERRLTALAMELIPRISRAQPMDALSSQAGLAGYRAVLLAANAMDKVFPLSMTAAGTVRPANVVVLGAGVAGLQAIATARRLGANVQANDVRAAAAEEVASLGARFIHIPGVTEQTGDGGYATVLGAELAAAQQAALRPHLAQADAVICTAQIPGRRAPVLLPAVLVEQMPAGAVVVDLPAEDGGNCALTDPDAEVVHHGVRIIPAPQLARTVPHEASALYARNVVNLVRLLVTDGGFHLDIDDDIVAGALYVHDGDIVHAPTREALGLAPSPGSEDS